MSFAMSQIGQYNHRHFCQILLKNKFISLYSFTFADHIGILLGAITWKYFLTYTGIYPRRATGSWTTSHFLKVPALVRVSQVDKLLLDNNRLLGRPTFLAIPAIRAISDHS